MPKAFRLGLTGGIGSGKSTVATLLAQCGAAVLDADALSRTLTAPEGAAIPAIRDRFGPEAISGNGALDRAKMRAKVFSDPHARQALEDIVHPLVNQSMWQQAQQAEDSGCTCLVFDIPLLAESAHWRGLLHQIWVVDCTTDTQIARVMQRNTMARAQVEAIIASQCPREQRLKVADGVIFNDDITLQGLTRLVQTLAPSFGLSFTHPTVL